MPRRPIGTCPIFHSMPELGTEHSSFLERESASKHSTSRRWPWIVLSIAVNTGVLALLTVPAWFWGGVQASTQFWLFVVGAVVMAGCWLLSLTRSVAFRPLPVALIPLSLALLLVALQMLPLSAPVHRWVSPGTQRWWQELAPRTAGVLESAEGGGYPISLYPASTRREFYLLALAVAAFTLGAVVLAERIAFSVAGVAIAVNGAVLAFFGLAQQLTQYGGLFPPVGVGVPFASYVNRNNAAGFLNMCLAAALAISVWGIVHTSFRRRQVAEPDAFGFPPDSESPYPTARPTGFLPACLHIARRCGTSVLMILARLNFATVAGLIAATCLAAGIFCSLSRGGTLAMAGAAVVTLAAVALAGHWRRGWLGLILVAGLTAWLLVSYVGKGDSVRQRLATLLDESVRQGDGRLDAWTYAWLAAQDLQPTGSGLGTFRYVYRLYQQQPQTNWFYHAENQYVQTLVEAGWLGLTLLLATLVLVALACWRLLRFAADPATYALGIAGTFALSSQAIAAFFDFGLYLPANMLLLAAICGAVCGRAAKKGTGVFCRNGPQGASHKRLPSPFSQSCCVALTGLLVLGIGDARRAAVTAAGLADVKQLDLDQPQPVEAVESCLTRLAVEPAAADQDVDAQLSLARLWIHRMRLGLADVVRRDLSRDATDRAIWLATDTVHLHGRLQQWAAQQRADEANALRLARPVTQNLHFAIGHLHRARSLCPLLPEIHLLLAQLTILADADADNRADLQRVRLTAPGQPALLTRCGLLELQAGRIALANRTWQASLALAPSQLPQILRITRSSIDLASRIGDLVPASPQWILDEAIPQFKAEADQPVRHALLHRAEELIAAGVSDDVAHASWLQGRIAMLREKPHVAVEHFTQALALHPENTAWRYELAVALQRLGRYSGAQEQARICVRMEPNNEQYEVLLRQAIRSQLAPKREMTIHQEY